jgi:hypothetical protein
MAEQLIDFPLMTEGSVTYAPTATYAPTTDSGDLFGEFGRFETVPAGFTGFHGEVSETTPMPAAEPEFTAELTPFEETQDVPPPARPSCKRELVELIEAYACSKGTENLKLQEIAAQVLSGFLRKIDCFEAFEGAAP